MRLHLRLRRPSPESPAAPFHPLESKSIETPEPVEKIPAPIPPLPSTDSLKELLDELPSASPARLVYLSQYVGTDFHFLRDRDQDLANPDFREREWRMSYDQRHLGLSRTDLHVVKRALIRQIPRLIEGAKNQWDWEAADSAQSIIWSLLGERDGCFRRFGTTQGELSTIFYRLKRRQLKALLRQARMGDLAAWRRFEGELPDWWDGWDDLTRVGIGQREYQQLQRWDRTEQIVELARAIFLVEQPDPKLVESFFFKIDRSFPDPVYSILHYLHEALFDTRIRDDYDYRPEYARRVASMLIERFDLWPWEGSTHQLLGIKRRAA